MRLRASDETRPQYLAAVSVSAPVLSSEHCRSIKIKPKDLNSVLVNAGDQKNATYNLTRSTTIVFVLLVLI